MLSVSFFLSEISGSPFDFGVTVACGHAQEEATLLLIIIGLMFDALEWPCCTVLVLESCSEMYETCAILNKIGTSEANISQKSDLNIPST